MLAKVGFAIAQGARAQKVTMEFDQTADFGKYKTFAIRDGQLNSRSPALNSPLVKKQIETDMQNDLTAKGLTMVTSGPADLNVRYTFGAARKTEVEAYPAGSYGCVTRYVRVPYAEGTMVIDLRDPTTRSLVWRAITAEEKSDATKIEGKLDSIVKSRSTNIPPRRNNVLHGFSVKTLHEEGELSSSMFASRDRGLPPLPARGAKARHTERSSRPQ